jgi:hypothetical protein
LKKFLDPRVNGIVILRSNYDYSKFSDPNNERKILSRIPVKSPLELPVSGE